MRDFKNKWILVTGASSGLGFEIAFQLASQFGAHLILVARREEQLTVLKSRINDNCDSKIELIKADLTQPEEIEKVITCCLNKEAFYGAVLNAGMTYLGEHIEMSTSTQAQIINLNIQSTLALTNAFVKHFEANDEEGTVMVVSSMAAFVPAPYQALYSGTKAFLTNFYHSLSHEIKNPNFKLSVFSPGGIKTEMTNRDEFNDFESYMLPVDEAAREALRCYKRGMYNHIPGVGNRIGVIALGFLPKRIFSKLMGKKYYKSIQQSKEKTSKA